MRVGIATKMAKDSDTTDAILNMYLLLYELCYAYILTGFKHTLVGKTLCKYILFCSLHFMAVNTHIYCYNDH